VCVDERNLEVVNAELNDVRMDMIDSAGESSFAVSVPVPFDDTWNAFLNKKIL